MISGGITASVGFLSLPTIYGIPLLIAGFGIMSGFYGVLNTIAWPRFFGRLHLGAISGRVMSIIIMASALAPSIFSFFYTSLGSYRLLGFLGLAFLIFLVFGSIKANRPKQGWSTSITCLLKEKKYLVGMHMLSRVNTRLTLSSGFWFAWQPWFGWLSSVWMLLVSGNRTRYWKCKWTQNM